MHPHRVVGSSEMLETPKSAPKKGLKGYLLIEFRKGALLVRLRFKVLLTSSGYVIQITESRSLMYGGNIARANRVVIGDHVSERQLFETVAEYISSKEKIPIASITFRWENNTLKMPIVRS
jgi:hypothetical protein